MKLQRDVRKRGRIEMLPLIDTVFLLLVFFIYAMLSMVVHRGIPIDLPLARTGPVDQSDYLSLSISSDGSLFLDKVPLSMEELPSQLRQRKQLRPTLKVFIGADRQVRYDGVVQVLDLVRQVGISQVALETKWKETP